MTSPNLIMGQLESWRKALFARETATIFLSAVGFFWFLIEVINWLFNNTWNTQLRSWFIWYLFVSLLWTLFRRRPVMSVTERLNNSDIWIEIRIANLFDVKADYVISTNSSFDTEISASLISEKSVQGAFTAKFYKNRSHLETELSKGLAVETVVKTRQSLVNGKTDQYRIGTVVRVQPNNTTSAYLVAISELNEHGTASSSFENVKSSLADLWNYVSSRGSNEPLAIPILGSL